MTAVYVTGDKDLDRALRLLGGRVASRITVKGIRAGMGEIRNAIKREVTKASVKRAIASKFKKRKGKGTYRAVVGGGVGKRNKARGGTRGGVGISKQNVHWYLMGTSGRQTKSGAYRGQMPANGAVKRGFAKSSGTAMNKVRQKMRTELVKEVNKLRSRR